MSRAPVRNVGAIADRSGGAVQQRRRLLPARRQVEGDARVDLSFPMHGHQRSLKSMVLRDLDGGHISTVSYDTNAPVERPSDLRHQPVRPIPAFGQILNQARGEKVEVVLQQTNADPARHPDRHRHRHREAKGQRSARTRSKSRCSISGVPTACVA